MPADPPPPPDAFYAAPHDTLADVLRLWEASGCPEGVPIVVRPDASSGDEETRLYPVRGNATGHDMEAAKEVQQRLLPVSLPDVPGWEFAGRYTPAGMVGGDYWSVKFYPQENIVTCKLVDVTGHGLAAAILMAAVKFVSGVLFRYSSSPSQVMTRTNHSLLRETAPDKMATMAYVWLYPNTGRARLVNAGHFPAFICRSPTGQIHDVPPTGPLLGLMETEYEEWDTHLAVGDVLFFCSDGVADAHAMKPDGDARVKEIVQQMRTENAETIADAVFAAARAGASQTPPSDDMSLVLVKRVA